jgi:hypothetical protein
VRGIRSSDITDQSGKCRNKPPTGHLEGAEGSVPGISSTLKESALQSHAKHASTILTVAPDRRLFADIDDQPIPHWCCIWNRDPESATPLKTLNPLRENSRTLSLILLSFSQLLYLLFLFAWLFHWMHFSYGNPIEKFSYLCGWTCSIAALCATPFGYGPHRFIMICVALTTAAMWTLAGVASVAL